MHDLEDGRLLDFGTKGSGRTPWSRTADGRLTLKGGVREILATEMLEALGVDTSKSFSLIETGEDLMRGDEPSPTRSSVLVRLSHSHIRIGSFQRLLYLDQTENIAKLLDYTIRTYMPDIWRDEIAARAVAFLEEVGRRVARTGAGWMLAGFVHGVLNTDNINVTGESFDYGPWRFLPVLDPAFTAAYFDDTGLYAYGRQPDTLLWNMTRLAECLLPFAGQPELEAALRTFEAAFHREFNAGPAAPAWAAIGRRARRYRPRPRAVEIHDRDEGAVRAGVLRLAWRQGEFGASQEKPGRRSVRRAGIRAGRGGDGRLRGGRRRQARPSLFRAGKALHHADRRGRGYLGADRRSRRLDGFLRQAGGIWPTPTTWRGGVLLDSRRREGRTCGLASSRRSRRPARLDLAHRHHAAAIDLGAHRHQVQRQEQHGEARAMTISGHSMLGSMVGPSSRKTDAG